MISINKKMKMNQSVISLAESVQESQRSSRANAYGNNINEFIEHAAVLIAK